SRGTCRSSAAEWRGCRARSWDWHHREGREEGVAGETEGLRERALLEVMRDVGDVVQAVEGVARASDAHQLAGPQHVAVADHVELTGAEHRVRVLAGVADAFHHRRERVE